MLERGAIFATLATDMFPAPTVKYNACVAECKIYYILLKNELLQLNYQVFLSVLLIDVFQFQNASWAYGTTNTATYT